MFKRPLLALAAAAAVFGAPSVVLPASAQAISVCGLPGTPPCERTDRAPRDEFRRGDDRRDGYSRPREAARVSSTCVTRELRCRTDDPRPVGSRCQCFDEDDDAQPGRVR